jgi:hypothetical protein
MVARYAFALSFCLGHKYLYLYSEQADKPFFKPETNEQQNILTENHTFFNPHLFSRNVEWTSPQYDIRV